MLHFLLALAVGLSSDTGEQRLYLSLGDQIITYRIDPQTGAVAALTRLPLKGAGAFAISSEKNHLYVMASENASSGSPAIATLQIQKDGSLKQLHLEKTNLSSGYLTTDRTGNYLAGNNYRPGKATIWKLDSGVYRGETVQEITLEERTHSVAFSHDNRWLLVPATGPNKIFINRFEAASGLVRKNDPPFVRGAEDERSARHPRHLVFHPTKELVYTTQEFREPGVAVWKWDTADGVLTLDQSIVTRPVDSVGISTATLRMTPDARFLYVSNRGKVDRQGQNNTNSIVGFRIDPTSGRLILIGHFPCEHFPNSFAVDERGSFLYVVGQVDCRLGVYRIDQETGSLKRIEQHVLAAAPRWVECLTLPR